MSENKIKEMRLAKHLSQEQLAEKAKLSVRTIQRLEKGGEGSIETLNLVAGALGVDVKDLFDDDHPTQHHDKIASAEDQLEYQLHQRRAEYKVFSGIFTAVYIVFLMAWGLLFQFVHNYRITDIMGVLWIGAVLIWGPLKQFIAINRVDKRLDAKYPLTASRIDKDKRDKKAAEDKEIANKKATK